jgi:hypothetical protein
VMAAQARAIQATILIGRLVLVSFFTPRRDPKERDRSHAPFLCPARQGGDFGQ